MYRAGTVGSLSGGVEWSPDGRVVALPRRADDLGLPIGRSGRCVHVRRRLPASDHWTGTHEPARCVPLAGPMEDGGDMKAVHPLP